MEILDFLWWGFVSVAVLVLWLQEKVDKKTKVR